MAVAVAAAAAEGKRPKIVKVVWTWPDRLCEAWVADSQVSAWVAGLHMTGSENIEVLDR